MGAQPLPNASAQAAPVISLHDLRAHCTTCSMRELCLPVGLDRDAMRTLDEMIGTRRKSRKGEPLYRAGELFTHLYAVRVGSVKTAVLAEDGREQVAGYHMIGDLVGLDGIGTERHTCDAIALEDSEMCAMPFARLEELARKVPALQHNLHRFIAREITRDHDVMLLLGSMRAEERLATFLMNLSDRYRRRGYSSTEFVLRMTREEIGSYLGLTLETVSRLFSRFQEEGLLQVQGRSVKIIDLAGFRRIVGTR